MTATNNADESTTEPCNDIQTDMFPTSLDELAVGDTAGLIEIEHRSGYGRIALERTEDGESDIIKLHRQNPDAESGYTDIETITTAGRWFARGGSWKHLLDDPNTPDP